MAYTLDAAGNLTSDGLRSFNMDANGRLAQVRLGLGSEEAATLYLHNALGQRVFKSEPQATQYAPDEEELGSDFINWLKKNFGWLFAKAQANATLGQSFVYADAPLPEWALLGEYGNGGSKSAGRLEIVWLPTEDGGAIPIGLYRNGRFYALHPDHLGTPRLITDEANLPVWQWPYSAFGANKPTGILKATTKPKQAYTNEPMLLKATNPAIGFNLRFPGQYFDEESNLNYNYLRSYQAAQGRYSQPDPIGLDGGLNRLGYVGGDAISNIDPKGQDWATSASMTICWFFGTCSRNMTFGPGSSPVSEMQYAPGVNAARAYYERKNQGNISCNCLGAQSVTNFAASFGLRGLVSARLNPTKQFVGSYRVDIYPLDNCKKKFVLTNTSSFQSFFYGIGPSWEGGPMGNMSQTYWWIE